MDSELAHLPLYAEIDQTYHDLPGLEPLREPTVQRDTDLPVLRSLHVSKRGDDRLVVARFLRGDDVGEGQNEVATGREDVVREWLRVCERDRVVDELDRLCPCDLGNFSLDRGCWERAVNDMRRAERLQECLVAEGSSCDDGREPGKLRDLNSCADIQVGSECDA